MNLAARHLECDPSEIIRALNLFRQPGGVTEIRAIDATTRTYDRRRTISGYFDDSNKLVEVLPVITSAAAVYFTPNEINPALLARCCNRLKDAEKGAATADHDVLRRRWLLIDCDPLRPSGVSSTDAEHKAAINRAAYISSTLSALEDWPIPVSGDSGNGAHLTYRIDLSAEDDGLIQRVLQGLAARFDTSHVKIDLTTFNPARVWKLYGTVAGKGDNTTDRPHRLARLLSVPGKLELLSIDLLKALADSIVPAASAQRINSSSDGKIDLAEWIARHGLDVAGPEDWRSKRGIAKRWVFGTCPWNSDHTNGSAWVAQFENGALVAGCHHHGCANKGWSDLRAKYDPPKKPGRLRDGKPIGMPRVSLPAKRDDRWREFPVNALPYVMERFATDLSRSLCVDPSMAALPMLSIAGASIGNTARARMSADYHAPANIWSAPVVRSGDRKSPVLRAVMSPIYSRQHDAAEQHAQRTAEYEAEMTAWKAKPRADRGDEPIEPGAYPHLYLSDTTTEAIAMRLSAQKRGLAVVLDELAGFFSGMNQYRAKGGNDRESYLAFYDAGPAKIDRKSATPPTIFISQAFVSVCGMIQPGALARALGPAEFDSGLAARFMLASPPPQRATWSDITPADDVRDAWRDLLFSLLDMPLPEQPALLPPSVAAMRLWASAHDRMEIARHEESDDRMRASRAKLIGAIPRLALIFQCVSAASGEKNATVKFIDETSMQRAIELAEWFTRETCRVYGMLAEDTGDDDLIARVEANGGSVTVRDLMRWSREFRTVSLAESYLDSLAHDGVGHWAWGEQRGRGRPRRIFQLLMRADADSNGPRNSENENCVSATAQRVSAHSDSPRADGNGTGAIGNGNSVSVSALSSEECSQLERAEEQAIRAAGEAP